MSIKSDHSAITLCINSTKDLPFGPSYWKFNCSLLGDNTYVQLINFKYNEWLDEFSEVHDKRLLWDLVKYKIRQVTIKYSKEKARERRAQLEEVESKIRQCEDKCNFSPSDENVSELENARNEYEILFDYIIQAKILRAAVCKYGELAVKTEISDFFILCQEKPFGDLFTKITIKLSKNFLFSRNPPKSKMPCSGHSCH